MYYGYAQNLIMQTFYEILDEIFETSVMNKQILTKDDYIDLKSEIIRAYEKNHKKRAGYISGLIKPKIFKISDDGSVEELKTCIQVKNVI